MSTDDLQSQHDIIFEPHTFEPPRTSASWWPWSSVFQLTIPAARYMTSCSISTLQRKLMQRSAIRRGNRLLMQYAYPQLTARKVWNLITSSCLMRLKGSFPEESEASGAWICQQNSLKKSFRPPNR